MILSTIGFLKTQVRLESATVASTSMARHRILKNRRRIRFLGRQIGRLIQPNAKFSRAADGSGSETGTPPALAETPCSAVSEGGRP